MGTCKPMHISEIGLLAAIGLATIALCGCSLDGLLLTELDRKGHVRMPDPAPVVVVGHAPGLPGAEVHLLGSDGVALGQASTTVAADGEFSLTLDGTTEFVGTILQARRGAQQLLGVLPVIPAQVSVLAPTRSLDTADLSPGMLQLDGRTTTLALLLAARARSKGSSLAAIPHGSLTDTLIELHSKLANSDPTLAKLEAMVLRLQQAAPEQGDQMPFTLLADEASLLRLAFLAAQPVDYTGDGQANGDTIPFDAALAGAIATFDFKACYRDDRIRVVLLAHLAEGAKDSGCVAIDPFVWADQKPDSHMFITGGVHPDTPVCDSTRTTACLSKSQIDAINATLGNWKPNNVAMYDDGSHGDGTANDGIWTYAFETPWWPLAAAPDSAGVRLAYKFTWGSEGKGWGGTEEFPGNQRVLELHDVNGDGLIVRFDLFADESSNKDKANGLPPSLGGCGVMAWPAEVMQGCATDVHERPVDLDGDCQLDGWPSGGNSAPLSVTCAGG